MVRTVTYQIKVRIESDGPCGKPGCISHEAAQKLLKHELEGDFGDLNIQRDYGTAEIESVEEKQ